MTQAPTLLQQIRALVRQRQGIPFNDYMQLCLYAPGLGYYMRPRRRIGAQGDFFTSSSVHRLFGRLIARQLQQMAELIDGPFTLVEQGAGEGHLALDILDALQQSWPDLYERITYRLIEISPDNRDRQAALLQTHSTRVSWCGEQELAPFRGCFLSNELLDAFPVAVVEKRQGQLLEVYVVEQQDRLVEQLRPARPEVVQHFARQGLQPAEGCRAEAALGVSCWLEGVAARLQQGFVLTIDYGYPAAELYAPFRRQGTLLCYQRHQASDNPYQQPGEQDITAHVDFSLLQLEGERLGLETLYFERQYRFLMALGFIEELLELQRQACDVQQACALRLTLKNLILPDGGMGDTFKVLIQGKNVGQPALLCQRPIHAISLAATAGDGC